MEDIASDDERGAAVEVAWGEAEPTAAESNRPSAEIKDRARTLSQAEHPDKPISRGWQPSFNNAVSHNGATSGSRVRGAWFLGGSAFASYTHEPKRAASARVAERLQTPSLACRLDARRSDWM